MCVSGCLGVSLQALPFQKVRWCGINVVAASGSAGDRARRACCSKQSLWLVVHCLLWGSSCFSGRAIWRGAVPHLGIVIQIIHDVSLWLIIYVFIFRSMILCSDLGGYQSFWRTRVSVCHTKMDSASYIEISAITYEAINKCKHRLLVI